MQLHVHLQHAFKQLEKTFRLLSGSDQQLESRQQFLLSTAVHSAGCCFAWRSILLKITV